MDIRLRSGPVAEITRQCAECAQADLEGKSLYAVCSHGSFGPDLLLTRLSGKLITATAPAAWRYSPQSFAQSFVSSFTADLRPDSSSK